MHKLTIIAIIASVALLGVGAWFLLNPVDRLAMLEEEEEQELSDIEANLDPDIRTITYDTYTNYDYGVMFSYPVDWKIVEEERYIRFYSPEVLEATNNAMQEQSDVLIEFDLDLQGDPEELFAEESHYEKVASRGNLVVKFEREEPTVGASIQYYIVYKGDQAISFIHPKDHPMSNFILYMVNSVQFFDV